MELQQLKKILAAEAKEKGICKEWYEYILNAPSKERLLMLFVKGLNFCLKNNYQASPLWAEFEGIRQHYGVFLNEPINAKDLRNVIAFGTSEGIAEFSGFTVSQVWARDNTKIVIKATGYAYVTIDIADCAEVEITASDAARVCVFLHGGSYTKSTTGNARINIIDKRK